MGVDCGTATINLTGGVLNMGGNFISTGTSSSFMKTGTNSTTSFSISPRARCKA